MFLICLCASVYGVTSKITRHGSPAALLEGEMEKTLVTSDGTVTLAREAEEVDLADTLDDVWVIHRVLAGAEGVLYLGTSPNGHIIRYDGREAEVVFPVESASDGEKESEDFTDISNEHVFAMCFGSDGDLYAAISGQSPRLLRLQDGKFVQLFKGIHPVYMYDMVLDEKGRIFLATGPKGKIYRFDASSKDLEELLDAQERNILCLTFGPDGFLYAGTDQRGVIYRVNPDTGDVSVVYDSEQQEITAIHFDEEGYLYAAATSAGARTGTEDAVSIAAGRSAGRPGSESPQPPQPPRNQGGSASPTIANTSGDSEDEEDGAQQAQRASISESASRIYRVSPEGFVTEIFGETAVFFALQMQENQLLLGTGNAGRLFAIDPATEVRSIQYEDEESSQITAIAPMEGMMYLACSNPAKLVHVNSHYYETGTYISQLIDAKQPAMWGKLQIEGQIPEKTKVLVASRSGNVEDPNDAAFSPWTTDVVLKDAVQLTSPVGRFCQYRLTLATEDMSVTPVVREVAVAHAVSNMAPRVRAVLVERQKDEEKSGTFKIGYKAEDANEDELVYDIEFRQVGRQNWIPFKEQTEDKIVEWDSRTVEDGRYEIRVTADDRRANTEQTRLTGSRISDPFVVDNTAPQLQELKVNVQGDTVTMVFVLQDAFSVIGRLGYTVDSNEDWIYTLPEDMIYDTTTEYFTIQVPELESGEHVVALKISDDVGNITYKSVLVSIP